MSKIEEIIKIIHFIEKCSSCFESGCAIKINEDYTVDVYGYVDMSGNQLKEIPIQFGKVFKYFDCSNNNLTSLKGSPSVVGGTFYCENNQLTSLEYCPRWVGDDFYCYNNNLTSLEYCPRWVENNFRCYGNSELKSLKGIGKVGKTITSNFFMGYLNEYKGEL